MPPGLIWRRAAISRMARRPPRFEGWDGAGSGADAEALESGDDAGLCPCTAGTMASARTPAHGEPGLGGTTRAEGQKDQRGNDAVVAGPYSLSSPLRSRTVPSAMGGHSDLAS